MKRTIKLFLFSLFSLILLASLISLSHSTNNSVVYGNEFYTDFSLTPINIDGYPVRFEFTVRQTKTVQNITVYVGNSLGNSWTGSLDLDGTTVQFTGPTSAGQWLTVPISKSISAGGLSAITISKTSGGLGCQVFVNIPHTKLIPYDNYYDSNLETYQYDGTYWVCKYHDPVFVLGFSDGSLYGCGVLPTDVVMNVGVADSTVYQHYEDFQLPSAMCFDGLKLMLKKLGSPTVGVNVYIYNYTDNQLLRSLTISASSISTSLAWTDVISFAKGWFVTGKVYRILINSTATYPNWYQLSMQKAYHYSLSWNGLTDKADGNNVYDIPFLLHKDPSNEPSGGTITIQINAGSDDCYVKDTDDANNPPWDYISTTDTQLLFGHGSSGWFGTGLRFNNVTVPKGAIITSAYVSFCNQEDDTHTPVYVKIAVENSDNATTFSTVADYNNRSRTSYVYWTISNAWYKDNWYNSADISSIVQSVVNRDGWQSGNSIVIFVEDNGSAAQYYYRRPYPYEVNTSKAPKLYITYVSPHYVESWYGSIVGKCFNFVESWFGSIIGKCFNFVEVWSGSIVGWIWKLVEVWRGVFPELPMFYIRSMMLYVGLGGLFCFMPMLAFAGKKRNLILLLSAFVLLILSWALLYIVSVTTNF